MLSSLKIFLVFLLVTFFANIAFSQPGKDTAYNNINPELVNIFNQKIPKKYKVSSIKVSGNHFFDENLLVSISGISVGDEIAIPGGDLLAKSIKKLWSQNYFSNVEIYITDLDKNNNISIEIAVTERPRLGKFYFTGIRKGEIDDLTSKTGLIAGRIVTENMKRSAIEAIKKYYAEKGHPNATVATQQRKDENVENSTNLYFLIEKGPKVKVNNVNFEGNTIPSFKLKKQLKDVKEQSRLSFKKGDDYGGFVTPHPYTFKDYLDEKGYLTYSKTKKVLDPYVRLKFFTSAKFDEKKYQENKEKLIEFYNTLGHRDAAIVKDKVYPNKAGAINIDISISEGHKYYFGNITWRGNTKYPDSVLTTILGIHKGDVYNLETLNKRLGKGAPEGTDISGLYQDDGYLFFRTEAVETAVYNDTIDYEIRMIEGPQATIKNIRIFGNEKTKENVIRRELRTIPGEKFSRTDLIRSQREIAQLNFFNQEKIGINPIPNPEDGTVDINYTVEEKSADQLELSAGWGGTIGLTGTLGVTFNNFSTHNIFHKKAWDPLPMGDGQKLSMRVQSNGSAFRSYNFSFTEPWLGGIHHNSLTFSVYNTRFANAYNPITHSYSSSAANNSYISTTGIGVSIGKQLKWPDDYFSISVGSNLAMYHLYNYALSQNLRLKDGSLYNNGYSNNLNLKISIQRASINQPLFPTSGSNILASVAFTPPYSLFQSTQSIQNSNYKWIEYHKWKFTGDWYIPLGKPTGPEHNKVFVLRTAAKMGFLGRYNHDLDISPFERFQLGDAGLSNQYALLGYDIIAHRGYPVYETSDPKVNPDQSAASQYFTIFNKYTMELRYPLSLNPSSTIFALAFFESANGWYTIQDYNPFRLRRSVGLGMRFFLPMFGLLGFDYGVGLDRIPVGSTSISGATKFTFMLGFEPE